MKTFLFAAASILTSVAGQAATLQAGTSAGDTANVVATCLFGLQPDVRGCTYDTTPVNTTTTQQSESWATYASGFYSDAWASASLGSLRTFAETNIQAGDSIGHNLQSHTYADMQDTVVASSSLGSLYNNYTYTVNITGSTTPSNATYDIPSIKSFAYVQLNIRLASTGDILASQYWQTSDVVLGGGTITGSISGVPVDSLLALDLFMETATGVGTAVNGQGGYAMADYKSTVHFYLDAATPGANTVGTSGFDYATAPVPELPAWALMLGGGVLLTCKRRRDASRN